MKLPPVVDVFISARFGPGHKHEGQARELHKVLNKRGTIKAVIVDVKAGQDFAKVTVHCLNKMKVMVIIGCEEYGALTKNGYCTHHEVTFAYENGIPIIIVQFCDKWPSIPSKNDRGGAGAKQNRFVLGKHGLCKLRWNYGKEWNVDKCAEQIEEAFEELQTDAAPSSQEGTPRQVPTHNVLPTTKETQYKSSRALGKIVTNQIDVCIISLHPPSMMHRISQSATLIYDMERKLKTLSKDNGVSVLLVDGNDPCMMNHLKRDLKDITSLIFIGEGLLMEKASTTKSSGQSSSDILDLLREYRDRNKGLPQVSFFIRHGAYTIKADLENRGFNDVNIWDLEYKRSKTDDIWKDTNLLGRKGILHNHFSSFKKKKGNCGYASVETLAWSPPTQDWRKIKNLNLKVGDAEKIDEIKKVIFEAVELEETKCFGIQPHSSGANNADLYDRASVATFYGCQESSRTIMEEYDSSIIGWYYVSKDEHLLEVVKEIKDKEQSGCIIIWIDCKDSSALNLKECLLETDIIDGDLKVIYIVTKTVETKDHDIVGQIKEMHHLRENDIKSICIHQPSTEIDLSQREVSVDVTLLGCPKDHGDELRAILLEEFFDTTSTNGNSIEQHEATFYRGDDLSLHVRVGVRHIQQLKKMFFLIFFPDSRKSLERKLQNISADIKLQFMMHNALKIFQECVLKLNTLTKDQKRALKEMEDLVRVLLDGRAGSGKTYVALHRILEVLINSNNTSSGTSGANTSQELESARGLVLLCLDTEPLGNDIAKWICTRLGERLSIPEKNDILKRVHIMYRQRSGDKGAQIYKVQIKDDTEEESKLLQQDPIDDKNCKYELIVVDEGHHVFRKGDDDFKEDIKRLLKENKDAQAMILCDSSQSPSSDSDYPEGFEKEENLVVLGEVVRSSPILTEASRLFQRYNQDKTTNHIGKQKGQEGLRPSARLFKSSEDDDYETCASFTIKELAYIKKTFTNENLHNKAAIIVSNSDARKRLLEEGGLEDKLDEMGFCAVTAMDASKRFSNNPPTDGKWHIIVDTISNMNGMERLFVIVVDMDKPLEVMEEEYYESSDEEAEEAEEERNLEAVERNQKNLSEIYCACTRGMLYVSFVNKYIDNGWMSFFQFTVTETPPSSPLPPNPMETDQDCCFLQCAKEWFSRFRPSNALSTKSSSRPLNEDVSSSASAKQEDRRVKTDDITVGVADDVCQGKSDATSSYTSSDVKVMTRTKIFDISKSNLDAREDIPTFYPLKLTIGMSKDDPYIYIGGKAPKVPFIVISPDVEEIQDDAIYENDVIEVLVIPKEVTHMGKYALHSCPKLKFVIFEEGSSLRHIGNGAFWECPLIEEINLPASLETLGGNAFIYCKGLKKVTLSPKMTTIEGYTFRYCSSLTAVEGMNGIQSIGEYAFSYCSSLETIDVNQSADIDDTAFYNCNARINYIN